MVLMMVFIGGITRLTGSGLSMVDWAPITGWLPPLSTEKWAEAFSLYRTSPEFRLIQPDMDLSGFKNIFWLEYIHRLVARITGLVFLLPLLYFMLRKKIDRSLAVRFFGLFVLGAAQGIMGWYMVKSGLVNDPHVSQYRLTAHLGMALLIYGYLLWFALDLFSDKSKALAPQVGSVVRTFSHLLIGLAVLTILSGGFVAGLKAGLAYNTFPLMGGKWFPADYLILTPAWHNIFDNVAAVQWDHRLFATITFTTAVLFWIITRRYALPTPLRRALSLLFMVVIVQFSLGIATLLSYVAIPFASIHQLGAFMLFSIALFIFHHERQGTL